MKRFIEKQKAFSLAEALITLLIVCLITLATIPILTKKKRDLSNSGHGVWMCTRNSADEYVYYSKEADNGDPSNPDTWTKTGTNSCEFKPVAQARNFSVTLIGGGGGGGDAISRYETIFSTRAGSSSWSLKNYTEEKLESDYYDVLVVGGGGGGGGANNHATTNLYQGPGGGGSGSWSYGIVYLNENNTYEYSVGSGGDAGQGRWNGGWTKPRKAHWAGKGGGSSFSGKSGDVNFTANGGGGGLGMGCGYNFWGEAVCGGGDGGSAAKAGVASATNAKSLQANGGITGQGWRSGREGNWNLSGGRLTNLPLIAPTGVGNGGNGPIYGYNTGNPGDAGSSGAVVIGQLRKWHGSAGYQGELRNRFIATLKGKVVVSIPPSALNQQQGGTVELKLVGDKVNSDFSFKAIGGRPGQPDKTLKDPATGENSPWSDDGGGYPGPDCKGAVAGHYGYYDKEYEIKYCVAKNCMTGEESYIAKDSATHNFKKEIPAFLEKAKNSQYKLGTASTLILPSTSEYSALFSYIKHADEYASSGNKLSKFGECVIIDSGDDASVPMFNINATSKYACYIEKDTGCFFDNRGLYYIESEEGCKEEKTEKVKERVWGWIPATPAVCEPAGNGRLYGAGGGGGRANSSAPQKDPATGLIKGLSGIGGKGAPGAVIIEW